MYDVRDGIFCYIEATPVKWSNGQGILMKLFNFNHCMFYVLYMCNKSPKALNNNIKEYLLGSCSNNFETLLYQKLFVSLSYQRPYRPAVIKPEGPPILYMT